MPVPSKVTQIHTATNDVYSKSNCNSAVMTVTPVGERPKVPEITLDTTWEQLYAQDGSTERTAQIANLFAFAGSDMPRGRKVAPNTKFLYQDRTFITAPNCTSLQQYREIQLDSAIKYLSLLPQRDSFVAGNMPVILFNVDASEGLIAHSKDEAEKTIISLQVEQRPRLMFFGGPEQMPLRENGIDQLVSKMNLDQLEGLPMAVNPDTLYFLNTKAALCDSGLPSPEAILLELEGFGVDPGDCCPTCKSADGDLVIRPDCTGIRGQWLETQVSRTMSRISSQPLPFVLKFQQSFGGGGTFVITSPEELSNLEHTLAGSILPRLYSQVTSANAYLKSAPLVLSEMIQDPVGNWGLTFFVTRRVSYPEQDKLKQKFLPLMEKIGSWLHGHGYFGPCGADILESDESGDDGGAPSSLRIVDLNGHFYGQRQLQEASSFSMTVGMSRDSFIRVFEDKIQQGKIIIISWKEDLDSGISYGSLVVGARDKQALETDIATVKSIASDIHF
ncbi:MAG: hypothetical protein Q9188_006156 [Gyalolechia gomerana]